ncbi:hypothetical protein Cantr_02514 [Candida viswanathii]|uniref:Uncharacterized protein n=1 Tax=Candida viswanathii TaxID=5486 RepID=A0A367YMK9_9ASCO|nr:hypothetical protein Cantr_02514 [Candida viswanathii]
MSDKGQFVKDIASSVAGSVAGNKVADKVGGGTISHIGLGVAGGIGGQEAEHKAEEEIKK